MLYTIGTEREPVQVEDKLPSNVFKVLRKNTVILDYAYALDRNYLESGGYSLIAETHEDAEEMRKAVNFTIRPCGWADRVGDFVVARFHPSYTHFTVSASCSERL